MKHLISALLLSLLLASTALPYTRPPMRPGHIDTFRDSPAFTFLLFLARWNPAIAAAIRLY